MWSAVDHVLAACCTQVTGFKFDIGFWVLKGCQRSAWCSTVCLFPFDTFSGKKAEKVMRALGGDRGGDELRAAIESFNQGKYGFQRAGSLRLSHFDGVDDVFATVSHSLYLSALCLPSWLIPRREPRDASLFSSKRFSLTVALGVAVVNTVTTGTASRNRLDSLVDTLVRYGSDREEVVVPLLLANPVEVVQLACHWHERDMTMMHDQIAAALGVVDISGMDILDIVKDLKSPSWAYPTEVQGLLREACLHVTSGRCRSLEEVCRCRLCPSLCRCTQHSSTYLGVSRSFNIL